jgi:hypothetical protein
MFPHFWRFNMSTINPIQNQPTANETTFCGSCLQLVYDMVNKVKEVVMAILQTILPCFFSSASSIDPNAVTQLNTGTVGQTPVDAVRHAQGQIAQQPIRVSADGIAQPAATPSGGSSAPAQPSVSLEADQENHPLGGTHSSVVPQPQHPAREAIVVGGRGDADYEAAELGGADDLAEDNAIAPGGGLVENPDEWLNVPFILPRNDGGSCFADQRAFGAPLAANGANVLQLSSAEQADGSLLPDGHRLPTPQHQVILPSCLTDPIPPHVAPTGTGPASSSASSSVPPATDPAGMRQPWMLPNSKVDPSSGSSDYNTLDQNLLRAAAAAAASREHSNDVTGVDLTGVFDAVFGLDPSPDEAIPAAAASSAVASSAASPLPQPLNAQVNHIKQQLSQIAAGKLTAEEMRAMRKKQNSADADDNKGLTGPKAQAAQPTQRTVFLRQGSGEEAVGFFAACTVAINWKENFDEFIPEGSEYDEILEQARTELNRHREGDFLQIAQEGGIELESLGIMRSRHAWVDILQTIAATRQKPMVVILTNEAYSMSYTVRIVPKGHEFGYELFSPNADWDPAVTVDDKIDPIYQSGQGSEALKEALPRAIKKYYAFELTGSVNPQHNNGTGSSDQFSAAAALPPGGVHAVAAPNPDQDPNPYAEQP